MAQTSPGSAVRGKAQAVREFHDDETHAGKPLYRDFLKQDTGLAG
jgi:hypothetical protein